jgi:hypothetical protein
MYIPVSRRGLAVLVAVGGLLLPALINASQAGASTLYACVKKDGTAHIYANKPKCKKRETKLSWSTEGPAGKNGASGLNGANGANGINGKEGLQGLIGPQGPGATTFTFDSAASASPTRVTLGAVPGGTISVDCFQPAAGEAKLRVFLQTSDGSWAVDYTYITTEPKKEPTKEPPTELFTNHLLFAAPSLSKPGEVDALTAKATPFTANRAIDFIQLAPAKARMIWHEQAETTPTTQTCHFSVVSFPSS